MWCDNCLLLLPLRAGAMAWGVFIAVYSLAGGLFLLIDGNYFFFTYPEWQIYGGIGLGVAVLAIVNIMALSSRSYLWTRASTFLWPFLIVICAIRAILIIVQLQRGKDKLQWECDHGGQAWSTAPNTTTTTGRIPSTFCATGFSTFNTAFIISLLVDIGCQLYMYFLTWRFSKRIEHYSNMKQSDGGYYS